MAKYVRFKIFWRFGGKAILPATVIGIEKPGQTTKGDPLTLSLRVANGVRALNTLHANNYIFKVGSGWINNFNGAGMPIAEKVAFGGNVARVLDEAPDSYLLDALGPGDVLPARADFLHVHRFTCVNALGQVRQPGDGFDAWVYFMSQTPFWVQKKNVDAFEQMPDPIWPGGIPADLAGYAAVALKWAVIRQRPEAESSKVGQFANDTIVRVTSEVTGYAKIGEKRWVALYDVRKIG